jgi:hypothetical protein
MSKPRSTSQKEILSGDPTPIYGKGNDIRRDDIAFGELSIGLKDLDYTIKYYLEQVIKPTIDDFGSTRTVPVVYGSPEKWKNIQEDGYYRDREGKILAPIIAYKRTGLAKNKTLGSKVDANHPQVYYTQEVKYSEKDKYDQFSKLIGKVPKKAYVNTVMADYVDLTYDVVIWTDFVEQMNSIVEAIVYSEGSFWGERDRFKFRTKIDSFTNTTDLLQDADRIVRTNFTLTLFGYITPDIKVKQLSEKLSEITYSSSEIDTQLTEPDPIQGANAVLSAIRILPDSATFEGLITKPNTSLADFYLEVNGQTVASSAITSIQAGPNNTLSVLLDVGQLGYTLAPQDTVTITGKYIS